MAIVYNVAPGSHASRGQSVLASLLFAVLVAGCVRLEGDPVFLYEPTPSFQPIPLRAYVGEFRDARPAAEKRFQPRTQNLAVAVRKGVQRDLALSGTFRDVQLDPKLGETCDLVVEGVIHRLYWENKLSWWSNLPLIHFGVSAESGSGRTRGGVDLEVTVRSRAGEVVKTYRVRRDREGAVRSRLFSQDSSIGLEATRAFQEAMEEFRGLLRNDSAAFSQDSP